MHPRLEVERCRRLLVGLSRRLATVLDQHRGARVPHGELAPIVTEWRSLPQAAVLAIPHDNIEGDNALVELRRLTAAIDGVSRRLGDVVRERADVPFEVLRRFKADLDAIPL